MRKGQKHTTEARAKMSASAKKSWANPSHRAEKLKNHRGMLGKKHSIETRVKMRKTHRGRKISENISEDTRASIRASAKNRPPQSLETRMKISATKTGEHKSPEIRKRMSVAQLGHIEECRDASCTRMVCSRPIIVSPTRPEKILHKTVLGDFPLVEPYKRFGRFEVDAYLPPPYHLAFEADGYYWHNLPGAKERDRKRDKYLLEEFDLIVIRLSEEELLEMIT